MTDAEIKSFSSAIKVPPQASAQFHIHMRANGNVLEFFADDAETDEKAEWIASQPLVKLDDGQRWRLIPSGRSYDVLKQRVVPTVKGEGAK